jgi:hypothetical protein
VPQLLDRGEDNGGPAFAARRRLQEPRQLGGAARPAHRIRGQAVACAGGERAAQRARLVGGPHRIWPLQPQRPAWQPALQSPRTQARQPSLLERCGSNTASRVPTSQEALDGVPQLPVQLQPVVDHQHRVEGPPGAVHESHQVADQAGDGEALAAARGVLQEVVDRLLLLLVLPHRGEQLQHCLDLRAEPALWLSWSAARQRAARTVAVYLVWATGNRRPFYLRGALEERLADPGALNVARHPRKDHRARPRVDVDPGFATSYDVQMRERLSGPVHSAAASRCGGRAFCNTTELLCFWQGQRTTMAFQHETSRSTGWQSQQDLKHLLHPQPCISRHCPLQPPLPKKTKTTTGEPAVG